MTRQHCIKLALLSILALSSGGCSWIFVDGPPADHAELEFFTCTTSKAAPRLDLIFGGLNLIGAVAVAAESDEDYYYDYFGREFYIGTYLVQAAVLGLSARSGFSRVSACDEALRQRGERNSDRGARNGDPDGSAEITPPGEGIDLGPVRTLPTPSWTPPTLFPAGRPGS